MRSRHGYSGSVFFIGLALLFLTGWWWPGILVIMAVSAMVRAYESGKPIFSSGHIFLFTIGIAFALGGQFLLPAILVALGLSQLPYFQRQRNKKRKRKAKRKAMRKRETLDRDLAPDISIDEFLESTPAATDGEYANLEDLFDEENERRR